MGDNEGVPPQYLYSSIISSHALGCVWEEAVVPCLPQLVQLYQHSCSQVSVLPLWVSFKG
jgi:hypothetical protein